MLPMITVSLLFPKIVFFHMPNDKVFRTSQSVLICLYTEIGVK